MTTARLHVITALKCQKALILRRGPTEHVAALLWDRKNNAVEMGQWLSGRIYEHRCDLSPDGRHFIYFAAKHSRSDGGACRTVLSRAPWLRHIAQGTQLGTWGGGGAFTPDGALWLNGVGGLDGDRDDLPYAPPNALPYSTDGFHMGGLYAAGLVARGWEVVTGVAYDITLRKRISKAWWLIWKVAPRRPNRALISPDYLLEHVDGHKRGQPKWEWADLGPNGLQVAQEGGLYDVSDIAGDGQMAVSLIRDFNDMTFRNIRAPYDSSPDRSIDDDPRDRS